MKESYDVKELLRIGKDAYERGQGAYLELLLDMLSSDNTYETKLSDQEFIKMLPFIEDIWLHLDSHVSTQYVIDKIFYLMKYKNISVEDMIYMKRCDVMDMVINAEESEG